MSNAQKQWKSDWGYDSEPKTFQGKNISGVTVERKAIRTKPNGRGVYLGGYRVRLEWRARRGDLVSAVKPTKREAIADLLSMEAK